MGLLKKFVTVSGLTVVSRMLGVVREALMAYFLGASTEMDAFTTAFKFPSFFRKFFAEGGFQSIFVPYYTDYLIFSKHKGARYFSSRIFTLIFYIMIVISTIVFIYAKEFTIIMAPGFVNNPEKLALATEYTRIIFPSIAFISLSTVYSGILISRQKFFVFSLAPIFINMILIASLFLCKDTVKAGTRLSYGTLAAGIFQFVYMFACVKYLHYPSPRFDTIRRTPRIKTFLRKMLPVLAGSGIAQINVFIGTFFASFLPTGCITYMHCSDRFFQFPLAIYGITIGTILLPEIAEKIALKQKQEILTIQRNSILFTLRLTMPSVIALFILSYSLISLLYGHGKFDDSAISNTTNVLKIMTFGLPAMILSKVISSILFAQKDTVAPVSAAVVSIIANIIVSAILIKPCGISGIAIASAIAGYVNFYALYRKSEIHLFRDKTAVNSICKIIIATVVFGIFVSLLHIHMHYTSSKLQNLLCAGYIISIGTIVYIIALYFLKDSEALKLVAKIKKRFIKR